jgi:hypothetical protein
MIIPALFLAAIGTNQDFKIPIEASAEFRKLAISIQDAYVEKNFEKGSVLIGMLPKTSVTLKADLTKVPFTQKPAYATAISNSSKMWQTALDGTVTLDTKSNLTPDIKLFFGPLSAPTWKLEPNSAPPKLIGSVPATLSDVTYWCNQAFAKYLGLNAISKGSVLSAKDIAAAKKVLSFSRLLQDSILSMAPDYRVPGGTSSEYHHLILDIKKALGDKDFVTASQLSALLPKQIVKWKFSPAKLNSDQTEQFTQSVENAVNAWTKVFGGQVEFKQVSTGNADISISFEPVLAKKADTNEIAGAAIFLGADTTQPRVETVIGLKRGVKLQGVMEREVFNECLFTFGRYFGLAPSPLLGSAMGRVEGQMNNPNSISPQDITAVKKMLMLSSQLRAAIQKKQSIESRQPILSIDRTSLEFSPKFQGDEGRASILVTNTGTSPLELDVRGDCGCISGTVEPILQPGKSTMLTGIFNTVELTGDVHHNLILKTNDPDRPLIVIPCGIMVNPRAEIIYAGSNTAYMDESERTFTFFVHSAEAKLFNIIDVSVIGHPLTAKFERFDGEVSNFQKLGQKQMVRGYKIVVDTSNVQTAALFGRSSGSVFIRTDSPKVGKISAQFFVQKGIVSLPETVYLGSPQGIADSHFVLARLGRPFSIKKVSSDSAFLTFEVVPNTPTNPSAYTIRVLYNGKATGHRVKGIITVETDDPKQPIIKLPIQTNQT